jgi:hypothetical protein
MLSGGVARTVLVACGVVAALHFPLGKVWTASSRLSITKVPERSQGACSTGSWSEPVMLKGFPQGVLPREPVLAVSERNTFVVGQQRTFPDSGPLPPNPLVTLGPSGSLGVPPGRSTFYWPRAVVDAAGTLHVVWAEPQSPDSARRTHWDPDLTSLWYASFSRGGWSVPEKVYSSSRRLRWAADAENLVVDSGGRLHATMLEWPHDSGVIHLEREHGRWSVNSVPATSRAFYSNLAAGRDGNLYLAYIAPDTTVRRDAGSVFFARSVDAGKTWGTAVQVSHSGRMQATSVRTLVSPTGVLHLVWGQNLSGGVTAEVIRHVASPDGGRTWSEPSDLPTEPSFRSDLRATFDACGVIHIVYHDFRPDGSPDAREPGGSELRYARWDGSWHGPDSPFPSLNPIGSDLARSPDGRVHLFLLARPASDHSLGLNFLPMIFTAGSRGEESLPSRRPAGAFQGR